MVIVRLVDGTTHDLSLAADATIKHAAEALSLELSVPATTLRFVHDGRVLRDSITIRSLNLSPSSFLICNVLQSRAPPGEPTLSAQEMALVKKWQTKYGKPESEIIQIFVACEKSIESTELILASP
jgi:hypothetical protein